MSSSTDMFLNNWRQEEKHLSWRVLRKNDLGVPIADQQWEQLSTMQFKLWGLASLMKIQPKGSSAPEVRRNEKESIGLCISNEKAKAVS